MPGLWDNGNTGQGPAYGEVEGSSNSGGHRGWESDWLGKARPGLCWVALLGAEKFVSHSYLAGVDATHWVASTQVLSVDGPCVPEAAVTELDINEVDLGLLQDITWSLTCEHRKK